jgi:hypothetical protein
MKNTHEAMIMQSLQMTFNPNMASFRSEAAHCHSAVYVRITIRKFD